LHLLNQFGSEILLRVLFVLGRREAGFHCPEIFAFTNQLPEILLTENLLQKRLFDTGIETLPAPLSNFGESPLGTLTFSVVRLFLQLN
jgi:hypothetical protein